MKNQLYFLIILLTFSYSFCQESIAQAGAAHYELNLVAMVQPVPLANKFIDPGYYVWCGSVTKDKNGKFYMLYSRWPLKDGFNNWPITSEIALAVANRPEGPYKYVKTVLSSRGEKFWDGCATHNPTVLQYDGKYYLYYMGTSAKANSDWWYYRNSARIGVAIANHPEGEWKRFDQPVINVSSDSAAFDSRLMNNPAVTFDDKGRVVMVYKAVANNGTLRGGKVRFGVAFADSPTGPFIKHNKCIFEVSDGSNEWMVAEDPYLWFDGGNYFAIVRDVVGKFTGDRGAFALMESKNGSDWQPAKNPKVIGSAFLWENNKKSISQLERPCLYIEKGVPRYLYGATRADLEQKMSFNVAVPLKSK